MLLYEMPLFPEATIVGLNGSPLTIVAVYMTMPTSVLSSTLMVGMGVVCVLGLAMAFIGDFRRHAKTRRSSLPPNRP